MRVFAFVNQKGGVAKTTSVINIGASLADRKRKVLVIDLDSQGALSICAGCQVLADDITSYDVLKGRPINDAIKPIRKNFDILPTDVRLSGADVELARIPGREFLLREALADIEDKYDVVLIDCPPSFGVLTLIALTAANTVIIPVKADFLALNGMSQLLDVINVVQKRMNPELEIGGIIATFFNPRSNLDQQVVEQINKVFPGKLFNTKIHQNTALAEAPVNGTDIFKYNGKSNGAIQYAQLAKEIIKREGV